MDVAQADNPSHIKVSQLEEAAGQAEKFDLTVTFELNSGALATYKIARKGTYFSAEKVSYKGQTGHSSLLAAMKKLLSHEQVTSLKALVVKVSKGALTAREIRPLAIAAWAEAANITCPDEASVGKEVQSAIGQQRAMREQLVADLKGGADGLKRFHARLHSENAVAKHLKEIDLSGLDLTGLSFYKSGISDIQNSNFERSNLTDARFVLCDLSECNFRSAIMDGADLKSSGCTLACFSQASLVQASFRGATLTCTDFGGADLTGVDFGHTICAEPISNRLT